MHNEKPVMGRTALFFPLLLALALLLLSCGNSDDNVDSMPDLLRVGILPDDREEVLREQYTPLFDYISEQLGVTYELIIPADYQALLNQFVTGKIDLAYFGGFTFIKAHNLANAVPLVMRDVDTRFTSYFIASEKNPGKSLNDFKGSKFSFGSNLSTSGHLMPRFFLAENGIVPENFFSEVLYSGSHDKTAYSVRDGIAEIGAANSVIIDNMIEDGRLNRSDLKVIWETPPYPDYVWAAQAGFGRSAVTKIRNAFMSISPSNKDHAAILKRLNAGGFLPASVDDFKQLETVAQQSGLLGETSGNL